MDKVDEEQDTGKKRILKNKTKNKTHTKYSNKKKDGK